jgi:precorrin-2/cobalt-factor-2 C20-methyltransferase
MVSLGCGDYNLVTIQALQILKNSDVICIPTKSNGNFNKSLTYKIIQDLFSHFDFKTKIVPVFCPMRYKLKDWENEANTILQQTTKYKNISFVTLGDASIYSSVYYILDIIKQKAPKLYNSCEVVAGITSFSYGSAVVKKPLCIGDSGLCIVPLVDKEIKNTTIYMRPKVGMDTKTIQEHGEIWTFENLNSKCEKISNKKIKKVKGYMTLFIDFFR